MKSLFRWGFLGLLLAIGQSCSQGGGDIPTLSVGGLCPLSNPLKPLPAQCCDGQGRQISFTGNCASQTPDDTSVNDALKAGSGAVAAARQAASIAESLLGPGNQIAKGGAQIASATAGGIGSLDGPGSGGHTISSSTGALPGMGATAGVVGTSGSNRSSSNNSTSGASELGGMKTAAGVDGAAGSEAVAGGIPNARVGGGAGGAAGGTLSWFNKLGSSMGFGGGAASGSGDSSNSMDFAGARGPASLMVMKSEDPADYFTRTGIQESLFKKVEKKYKDTAFSWARQSISGSKASK